MLLNAKVPGANDRMGTRAGPSGAGVAWRFGEMILLKPNGIDRAEIPYSPTWEDMHADDWVITSRR